MSSVESLVDLCLNEIIAGNVPINVDSLPESVVIALLTKTIAQGRLTFDLVRQVLESRHTTIAAMIQSTFKEEDLLRSIMPSVPYACRPATFL